MFRSCDGTLPDGDFTERMEYDERGRQILAVSFEGAVTRFIYDDGNEFEKGSGRLKARQFFDNLSTYNNGNGTPAEEIVYSYDPFGRLVAVDNDGAETTYEYDARGQLVRTVSPEGAINYEYDHLGRKTRTFTGPANDAVNDFTYEYDALGRLAKVTVVERNDVPLTTPEETAYAYDLQGNLDRQINPNGVIADYDYDNLNRLTDLVHYLPDETPETLADNDKLAEFNYEVREDGRRSSATETFWFDSAPHVNTINWTYDDAGRLIDEVFDHYDDQHNQTQHFTYDLVGNRLLRTVDEGNDASIDQVFASVYDANDRLLTEEADTDNDNTVDQTTTYGYTGTQQTGKTVVEGNTTTSETTYEYNLDGRLKTVSVKGYTDNSPSRVEKSTYAYDHTGIRVSTLFEVDADVNESFEEQTKTTYLIDHQNFTGYQQVLEATVTNAITSDRIKKVVYAIGHDQITQTTFTPNGPTEGETLDFHTDGHGSTRVVTDLAATILQIYAYDAFGVAIGFEVAQALTEYLYNNEQFDHRVALQYLRRRFYDAKVGRFAQLDEFTGNNGDPQSYHKYLYAHADPVNGWDPTGLMTLVSSMSASQIGGFLNQLIGDAGMNVLGAIANRGQFDWTGFGINLAFAMLPIVGAVLATVARTTGDIAVYLKGVHTRLTQLSGEWTGTIGNSFYKVSDANFITATGGKGVRFKANFPDFSEWTHAVTTPGGGSHKVQFDIDLSVRAGSAASRRNQDFAVANERFAREFLNEIHTSGPRIGKGKIYKAKEYLAGTHPQNVSGTKLTWHHHENMTTMMLVPTDIHGPLGHTGGRGFLDFMLGLE